MEEVKEVKEVKGSYKIENIILISFEFWRKDEIDFEVKEIQNKIDITTEIGNVISQNKIVVSVILSVNSTQFEENIFSFKIKMTGVFLKEGEPALPEEAFKKL